MAVLKDGLKAFDKRYTLGDALKSPSRHGFKIAKKFPDSIVAEYFEGTRNLSATVPQKSQKVALLSDIVRKRGARMRAQDLPGSDTVVVHLRMGDVLAHIAPEELSAVWDHGVSLVPLEIRTMTSGNTLGWWSYLNTRCFFKALTACLIAHQPQVNRVTLVGSAVSGKGAISYRQRTEANTYRYGSFVKDFFQAQGYAVDERFFNHTADDDFVWM